MITRMPGWSRLLPVSGLLVVNSDVPAQTVIDSGFDGSGKLIVMVLVVVFLFLLRYQWRTGKSLTRHAASDPIRLVSTLTLGMREKLAVIDVGGQRVLIGIAQGNIRTLAQWQAPVATESTDPAAQVPSAVFGKILQRMMP